MAIPPGSPTASFSFDQADDARSRSDLGLFARMMQSFFEDVNQGRVSILLPGVLRDNPDYFAIAVMNRILGGGGFTSRIVLSKSSS